MKTETTDVAVFDKKEIVTQRPIGLYTGLASFGTADAMLNHLDRVESIRKVINTYVDANFIEGVDYGKADERTTKNSLLKAGAEKLTAMFGTHAVFEMDRDTWEMLGRPEGTVCYKCQIVDNVTGNIIGEGRGCEKIGNKGRDANKAVKICEKCALVDAVLYTFMLSDRFTQDSGKVALTELKTSLMNDISDSRAGVKSDLTDLNWLIKVLEQEIHKKRIDTLGEFAHVRKVIFEEKVYDLSTGARK